jgi:hypothetical protein
MENININIRRMKALPGQAPLPTETPFDERFGYYGIVVEVHYKNNTVDVRSDSGRVFTGIRVASDQWITLPHDKATSKNKDKLTGRRHLPPKNTHVLCFTPTGEPSSAVVLCSIFAYQDPSHAALRDGKEDNEFIDERVDSGGWKFTHDIRTGTRKIQNAPKDGEETIKIDIDQEEKGKEKVTITIHGNVFTVDKDNGVDITSDKNLNEAFKGKSTVDITGKAEYKSADTDIKSIAPVGINGGSNNLNAESLTPYWNAEIAAWTALQTIVTNPLFMVQMTLLDAVSGGIGSIISLASGLIALCSAHIGAETAVIASSKPIIK